MLEKPCVICPIYEICAQALKDSPCPVNGATEEDTVKCVYKED